MKSIDIHDPLCDTHKQIQYKLYIVYAKTRPSPTCFYLLFDGIRKICIRKAINVFKNDPNAWHTQKRVEDLFNLFGFLLLLMLMISCYVGNV